MFGLINKTRSKVSLVFGGAIGGLKTKVRTLTVTILGVSDSIGHAQGCPRIPRHPNLTYMGLFIII